MPNEHRFPSTLDGERAFRQALKRWVRSKEPIHQFFPREYDTSETTVYATARRLGVQVPTNRGLNRRAIIAEQRADDVPPAIVAWRHGIATVTLRQWASKERLRLRGNTKKGREKWWRRYFDTLPSLEDAFYRFEADHIPAHLAIEAYHACFAPQHPICWDATEVPPVVITDWEDQDFVEAVAITTPVPPDEARLFLGQGSIVHAVEWPADIDTHEPVEEEDPHTIVLAGGQTLRRGEPATLMLKSGTFRHVEYRGLQHNGLALTRDIDRGTRRVTSKADLYPFGYDQETTP